MDSPAARALFKFEGMGSPSNSPNLQSLWHRTGPKVATNIPSAPSENCDSVIVGAGLAGLTAAVLLARAGLSVTVLEARRVGALTTGNTTGKLSMLQGTVYSELLEHAGEETLRAYAEANREGQAWLIRFLESCGEAPERRDAYTYAFEASQAAVLEAEYAAMQVAGIEVESTTAVGLPFETYGALRLEDQAQLQPMQVLNLLAAELRERNGKIYEQLLVTDIDEDADFVTVTCDDDLLIRARHCVIATGTPVRDRGRFFARLEASRSFVGSYLIDPQLLPRGMYVAAGDPQHSLRTAHERDGREVLVVGGESHTTGRADSTTHAFTELDAWVRTHFGAAERTSSWAAQDYRMHSRVPFFGPMPGGDGRILVATGFNKWGMTNAVASALAIAGEVLDGSMWWAKRLQERSPSGSTVRDTLAANASVARHLVGDWVRAELRSVDSVETPREGEGVVVRADMRPVGVSTVEGTTCRVSAVCPHMGGVLNWNAQERSWDCPLHASRFTADGKRLEGPALSDLAQYPDRTSHDSKE